MKNFLQTFIICYILITIFDVFGGALIFGNIWGGIGVFATIFAVLITTFIRQDTKMEELEARIKALETKDMQENEEVLHESENL